ncbi:MAG: L-serine ammonia-lyase [Hyphomicrobiaceae bacterium]
MFHSVFQIFKIGIGPSSSHTMGPMSAAVSFRRLLEERAQIPGSQLEGAAQIVCRLFGSLAFTGPGHCTDRAVCLGLLGFEPDTVNPDEVDREISALEKHKTVTVPGLDRLAFDPATDIQLDFDAQGLAHPNTLSFELRAADGSVLATEIYCSIGGGFVVTESEMSECTAKQAPDEETPVTYPFSSMADLLAVGQREKLSIAEITRRNELCFNDRETLDARLSRLLNTMDQCVDRGLRTKGALPGSLKVERRACKIHERLLNDRSLNTHRPHSANDWISAYAMAVNEENAAGNQIVTAPTNGAAGVVPAVLRYYREHLDEGATTPFALHDFILVAGTVGSIIKQRASISGAEVGCQGEVGSAAAMAAAGLCAVLGGTNEQIENAAEIALEHHLGMTCDPIRGLVQVPCIERNAFGAIKAVSAASLALHGDGRHVMPLDNCIEAMRQTGIEMNSKYKETSQGGLAVNLPEC